MHRISHDPVGRTPRHAGKFFRAKIRRSDSSVFNIEAKKLDLALKPSHFKEISYLTHCHTQKSKCPRRF